MQQLEGQRVKIFRWTNAQERDEFIRKYRADWESKEAQMKSVDPINYAATQYVAPIPLRKQLVGEGVFRAWGIDFEELGSGTGNFSTAIVTVDHQGGIKNIPVELIEFINDPNL